VLQFDTFLSANEAEEAVRVGGHKFERSLAGYSDGVVSARTSSTSWCNVPVCEDDPVMIELKAKIVELIEVPMVNTEHLQVLRYEPGQFYKLHHDQNSPQDSPSGPRVYTFFIYLSEVEGGGETRFPRLNLTVTPKTGRAILWHSVKDSDVYQEDMRTEHEALPVTEGRKYAANFWTHLRDFQTPHGARCDTKTPAAARRRELHKQALRGSG